LLQGSERDCFMVEHASWPTPKEDTHRTQGLRLSSAVVEEEVNHTPSSERRSRVRQWLSGAHGTVALTAVAISRAQELKALGFRTYDALHLACAEQATVDIVSHH